MLDDLDLVNNQQWLVEVTVAFSINALSVTNQFQEERELLYCVMGKKVAVEIDG